MYHEPLSNILSIAFPSCQCDNISLWVPIKATKIDVNIETVLKWNNRPFRGLQGIVLFCNVFTIDIVWHAGKITPLYCKQNIYVKIIQPSKQWPFPKWPIYPGLSICIQRTKYITRKRYVYEQMKDVCHGYR